MNSILLDTNLWLLLVVGMCNRDYIAQHKRTQDFLAEDFDLLLTAINSYEQLWITSHCLAEVSNLLRQTHRKLAQELISFLAAFATRVQESHLTKASIFTQAMVTRLGVADTGMFLKSKRVTVLTVDLDLYLEILRAGRRVINFNHLRQRHLLG
jgi:hypothetical protein